MRKERFWAILVGVVWLCILLINASANMNIRLINNTEKPIEFAVSEPDGSTSSELQTVAASGNIEFSLNELLKKHCDQHHLCDKTNFWVVLEKWGKTAVYLRCPKMYSPKQSSVHTQLSVTGDDTSTLSCSIVDTSKDKKGS